MFIGLITSDVHKAYAYLLKKRSTGEDNWDMAEVRWMKDPPRTIHKWCVFRKEEGDDGYRPHSRGPDRQA
jgi:hypothetical protein